MSHIWTWCLTPHHLLTRDWSKHFQNHYSQDSSGIKQIIQSFVVYTYPANKSVNIIVKMLARSNRQLKAVKRENYHAMPCYQVKNLQMKGVMLPWGSVCAVFQDSSEFQKSSISTMSDTYVLVRLLVFVNCMKQSIRSNFVFWGVEKCLILYTFL